MNLSSAPEGQGPQFTLPNEAVTPPTILDGQGQQYQNSNIAPPTEASPSSAAVGVTPTQEAFSITGLPIPKKEAQIPTSPSPDIAVAGQLAGQDTESTPATQPAQNPQQETGIVRTPDTQKFTSQTPEAPSANPSTNEAQDAAALDVPNYPLEDNRGKSMDTQFPSQSQQPTEANSVPKETPTKSKYDAIKPTLLTHIKKMNMQDALNFINESVIHGGPNNSRIDDAELEQTYLEVLNDYLEEKKQGLQQAA